MKKCGSCVRCLDRKDGTSVCSILQTIINKDGAACQFILNKGEMVKCDICGRGIDSSTLVVHIAEDQSTHFICTACAQSSNTCKTCIVGNQCDFETNPINLPPYINQTSRQGYMQMTQTVKNPERIKETCEKNCPCYSQEFGCLKEFGSCGGYKICLS